MEPQSIPLRSTFSALLGAYHPELGHDAKASRPPSQRKGAPGIKHLLEGPSQNVVSAKCALESRRSCSNRGQKSQRKKGSVPEKDLKAGGQKSVSAKRIVNERDLELKRKRIERAEATLRKWELLQQEERNERYSVLKRRVQMQRELITKMTKLSEENKEKAEEEIIDDMETRRGMRKEMIAALRSHTQKVEEHKKKIAAKLVSLHMEPSVVGPLPWDGTSSRIDDRRSPVNPFSSHWEKSDTCSSSIDSVPLTDKSRVTGRALHQQLRVEAPSEALRVETLWSRRKADVARMLRPVALHCDQVKQIVSPSVRQCLDIYEQPTARDRFTGKMVPLTDVLTRVTRSKSEGLLARQRRAIARMATQNEERAHILLTRRDVLPKPDPGSYVEAHHTTLQRSRSKPNLHVDMRNEIQTKHLKDISPQVKKKLPHLLTGSGDLVATSLEEVGEQVYYRQSTKRWRHSGPTFLTDLEASSDITQHGSTKETRTKHHRWQPLSCSALSEYSGVTEIPVTACFYQGSKKVWRPLEATAY